MSTVVITENGKETIVVLPKTASDEVIKLLSAEPSDEQSVVLNFLTQTGTTISFETPQSSNVVRVTYNAHSGEIGFVFDNGSESTYLATFADFVAAMSAPSIGKLQWQYRRGFKGV